ncbi:UDP-N-acetylmuramoyl-L-alanyl-D-glutamate--2,6-diaminopimelate ligase [Vibrio breoganii]|uniref:UDP-N-acetylmuramoyl-L-alanyl-D-glutamate--2,6-diaminopimelate ligase n=1 Tax=Vibrio breoganii TaxID=553239 RepID=A0AAN0XT92_9VIBR|nr:UDP-N-acetylmuramoyl-L-alanyl-D-glutamate--2,6-diaminopimelate ligase [Vibrio breoganii]ANO32072.1 UDP-N-acetylmuramoyl-L-alanyl-D-glutamate--2,6-diaminopimelate ligase [Vibrio breoganii]OED84950.1 UDP-N-acetylmuramoyl-L-alanyl-D-glutamate--2,6-diaminopimelate ligase [Vibrio breoganii ZF-55]PMO32760.1 UDP-N-acetylmuramoyl-L-alanyl-D-glutamate--2,6-diaminopimelate ligase [Vibrio breoganii]PMO52242.1 UDP-N-acetylmuramoyl-L-alanyl-D-glutamate--2,6-diaminopimelate ligase [Vibrio breoganii]
MNVQCTLQHLVQPWLNNLSEKLGQISVSDLELDSRQIQPGSTFVAIKGHTVDGRRFISNAVKAGASLVIAESDDDYPHGSTVWMGETPVLYLDSLSLNLSAIASRLYRFDNMDLIAVTGTNGKTTITQIIAQWLDSVGKQAAVMGTTGNGFLSSLKEAKNTTGSAIEVCKTLSQLSGLGADITALETSSHGLVQHRIKALKFVAAVFTNLSRDHLDYHGSMAEYAKAKLSLFTEHSCKHKVINADDSVGQEWLELLPDAIAVSLLEKPQTKQYMYASNVRYSEQGIEISFESSWGKGVLKAPLIGEFNASNLLLGFTTLLSLGFDIRALQKAATQLQPVIGRMELFQTADKAKVVVDYAHTPDALEKALCALRVHCEGQLWAIFGCGGDRDSGKRPMMAQVGERFADRVILADDNPRSEDPALIIQDMLKGVLNQQSVTVEHDRFKALSYAIEQATSKDIILLAGKGHEDYQILGDDTIHYSDRESAMTLLELI